METTFQTPAPEHAREHSHDEANLTLVEIIHAGSVEAIVLKFGPGVDIATAIREALALEAEIELFERDMDAPFKEAACDRKALRLIAHRSKKITVKVRYEHRVEEHAFSPSKTVFKVLQWVTGPKGFNLDATSAARANLILPGADTPLPREAFIGSFVAHGHQELVLDLTLKDFTNG